MQICDFRSDTVTKPTEEMYKAMMSAKLGDDGLGDDPTVNELEEMSAKMFGMERALFMPSGTMANQVAVRVQTSPGDEVILEENGHTFNYEVGGLGWNSGVQARSILGDRGLMSIEDIKDRVRDGSRYNPETALIIIENTHNFAGGRILPLDYMKDLYDMAKDMGVKVHLDGARIFNASVATDIPVDEYAKCADSLMFCLSKGLSCPIGSIILGSDEFIEKSIRVRQSFGGSMRQVGILASCGIVALNEMVERLSEDHRNARLLARGLEKLDRIEIDADGVQTNIVIFRLGNGNITAEEVVGSCGERGVLFFNLDEQMCRMVTHRGISDDDVRKALLVIEDIFSKI